MSRMSNRPKEVEPTEIRRAEQAGLLINTIGEPTMRQMLCRFIALTLMLALADLGTPTSVSAATNDQSPVPAASKGPASSADQNALVRHCYVTPKAGVDAVNVRSGASTASPRFGIINHGQRAAASCTATKGRSYKACGGTSPWWVRVTWLHRTGYVAWRCVNWYY